MPVAPLSVTARTGLPWSSIRIVPALPSAVWSMNAARRHGSSTARFTRQSWRHRPRNLGVPGATEEASEFGSSSTT